MAIEDMAIEETLKQFVYKAIVAEIDKQAERLKAEVARALGVEG